MWTMMQTSVLTLAGLLVGGYVGIRVMMPPDDPTVRECGLMMLPAILIGLPAGAFVGATLGLLTGFVLARRR
jgi:hypothetical protein